MWFSSTGQICFSCRIWLLLKTLYFRLRLDLWKSKRVPEKYLFLLSWLCQSLWLCGSLWKILKEIGILDHLTCLLRNLYAGQEATVQTEHGTTNWFQIGKGICQVWILSPCLFNFYAECIMRNAGLEEAQVESRLPGEIPIPQICRWHHPYGRVKRN